MRNQTEVRDLTDPEIHQACCAAMLEVLETMFFELPLDELEIVPAPAASSCLVRAGFRGTVDGVIHVAISCSTCTRLTASFLGKEAEEVVHAEECSTALELANMLCGATLSRLEPQGRLAIETPYLVDRNQHAAGPWLRYPLEDGDIEVALSYGEGL
ncbi:chemotaxis protein CheX [uncultured Paludibaculum sp.]|uniref:chemotaxis protein CheX n=1 Tax=uncultured Paludibaculum sp. TaxID=1765020 RepID=UPI002AAC2976|nr:chemotaxis protein CheX [uncultured Paludibaculum sp.]